MGGTSLIHKTKYMARIIIDLLGRKFKVIPQSWELVLDYKKEQAIPKDWVPCYTADRYTREPLGLFYSPDCKDYIMMISVSYLRAYVIYKLKFLGYYEQYDMRLEYKYGKVKLPKQ